MRAPVVKLFGAEALDTVRLDLIHPSASLVSASRREPTRVLTAREQAGKRKVELKLFRFHLRSKANLRSAFPNTKNLRLPPRPLISKNHSNILAVIPGGMMNMMSFLKNFPSMYRRKEKDTTTNQYWAMRKVKNMFTLRRRKIWALRRTLNILREEGDDDFSPWSDFQWRCKER